MHLEGETDSGKAMSTIRQFLSDTLEPYFGEDRELAIGLADDDPMFQRIATGEWDENSEEIIAAFIKGLPHRLVVAEHKIGPHDAAAQVLAGLSAVERRPLLKVLGQLPDKTAFRKCLKLRLRQVRQVQAEDTQLKSEIAQPPKPKPKPNPDPQ